MTYIHLPDRQEKKAVHYKHEQKTVSEFYDWRSVDETPEHSTQQVLTRWTDGEYEVIKPADYPDFWEGKAVHDQTMTHWRYIDPPSGA